MDLGLIAAIAALIGVVANFIRFGHWQGSMESRVNNLEQTSSNTLSKFDDICKTLNHNTIILTEMKTRLDVLFDEKKGKKK